MKKIFALILVVALLAVTATTAFAGTGTGFDQYGYNDNGNIFNGTGSGWCLAGGQSADCMGAYSNDNIIMKWNEAWDVCNDAGNNDAAACAGAWTSNQWNGAFPGGSGEVWHYKMIWVGALQWNVTGDWDIAINWLGTDYIHITDLVQTGTSLTGTLVYPGDTKVITSGSVVGNKITIFADYIEGGTGTVTLNGTIANDGTMSGTWLDTWGGLNRAGTWTTTSGIAVSSDGPYWKNGGYRIWGNYEVIMDQGMSTGAHEWLTHAVPNGYGN
jgi:hypothetical protein